MKKIAFVVLCLGAQTLLGPGCVVESDEGRGGDSRPDESRVEVTWSLVEGFENKPANCPPEAAVAEVVVEPLGDADETLGDGDEQYYEFDCRDQGGVTGSMYPGPYLVWVNLVDDRGFILAQSGSQELTVTRGRDTAVAYEFSIDRGNLGLAWTLSAGTIPLTCEDAGATVVQVLSFLGGPQGMVYEDHLDCAAGQGFTRGLPLGSYYVEVSLLDARNQVLGAELAVETSLDFGNDYRDLGVFELQLAP